MARVKKEVRRAAARRLGAGLGEALAEGLAQGVEEAFERVRAELLPLGEEVVALLRREVLEDAAEALANPVIGLRACTSPGCERRAVARTLCRRHYARQVYQERKARQPSEDVEALPRPRLTAIEGGGDNVEKKSVVPVAPIVRRKKNEGDAAPELPVASSPAPAAAANGGITVESVARFLGVKN